MDREKIIKGLEHCRIMCEGVSHNPCSGCPYQGHYTCADRLKTDAIALLKEQEAVMVHDPGAFCPQCGWMLYPEDHPKFCGNCGQTLKWELLK